MACRERTNTRDEYNDLQLDALAFLALAFLCLSSRKYVVLAGSKALLM